MIKDQFDIAAERLVLHLTHHDAHRNAFATAASPEEIQARVEAIAAFLRDDFWNEQEALQSLDPWTRKILGGS